MKRLQRWTALFLALLMLVSAVPFAAAEASTTTLFSQDFDNVDAAVPTDWTQVVRSGSGTWAAATHNGSGALTINTSAGSDNIITTQAGNTNWTDYTYSADISVGGESVSPGLIVRCQEGSTKFYTVLYTVNNGVHSLRAYKVNGLSNFQQFSGEYVISNPPAYGTTMKLAVKVAGNVITAYLNETEVYSWTDSANAYPSGGVGLRIYTVDPAQKAYYANPRVVASNNDTLMEKNFGTDPLENWNQATGSFAIKKWNNANYLSNAGKGNNIITVGQESWTDYLYTMDVVLTGSGISPSLLFRCNESGSLGYAYLHTIETTGHYLRLYKITTADGWQQVKSQKISALEFGQTYQFAAEAVGGQITCYLDGIEVLSYTDAAPHTSGRVGVRVRDDATGDAHAYFADPKVVTAATEPTPPAADDDYLFYEPFDTLSTTVWTSVQDGNFQLKTSQDTNWLTSTKDGLILANGAANAQNWNNYEVTAKIRMEGNGEKNCPGLIFYAKDVENFYMLHYSKYDRKLMLYKRVNNKFNVLKEMSVEADTTKTLEYKVHVYNSTITCYLNGYTYLQHSDTTYTKGGVGFRSYTNNTTGEFSMIDDIQVKTVDTAAEIVTPPVEGTLFADDFGLGLTNQWSGDGFTGTDGKVSGNGTLTAGTQTISQYRLETVILNGDGEMGVTTHGGAYKAGINFAANTVSLYKGDNVVAQKAWEFSDETVLAITVNGNKVSVWADESKMMDYTDEDAKTAAGQFGVWAAGSFAGSFDSVMTREIWVPDALPGDEPYDLAPDPIAAAPTTGDATYYVALNGKDTWSGTLDHPNADGTDGPFATIEAAAAAAADHPGHDTVLIRGGTYYLEDTITLTSGNVTFAAYPGETPVISGGREVTSTWTKQENSDIWTTTLSEEFADVEIRQMFVEDARATRSREPDGEYWGITSVDTSGYAWIVPKDNIPAEWENLTGVEMNSRGEWHYNRQAVDRFDVTNNKVITEQYIGTPLSSTKIRTSDWLYFENALLFVDTEGEWFYDADSRQMYYLPVDNADPNQQEIVIPVLETLVEIGSETTRVEELDFYGLTFQHTTWSMNPYGDEFSDYERRGIQAGFWGNQKNKPVCAPPAALLYTNTNRCRIQNNLFAHLGEGAIAFGANADSNLIYANEFDDVGANVIQVGWRATYLGEGHPLEKDWDVLSDAPIGNEIIQNYIHDSCVTDQGSVGIWTGYSNHNLISHNTIEDMPYSGLNVGWRWTGPEASKGEPEAGPDYVPPYNATTSHNNIVEWNWAVRSMQSMADGGGLYFVGEQYGNKVMNNWVSESKGHGLYFDEKSNHTEVAYNYYGNDLFQNRNRWFMDIHDNYSGSPADPSLYGTTISNVGQPTGGLYAVTFTMTPANAVLTVNGEIQTERSFQLPAGTYSYTVTVSGYEDFTGSFTVADGPVDVSVNLEQDAIARVVAQIEALPETDEVGLSDKDDIEAAREALDNLTDAQEALVSDEAKEKLEALEDKLDELQAAADLAQAKEDAKEKLAAYRAIKADADYRDAQVAELNNAVTASNAAIDAAATEAAVAEALADAKAALDAVKTDAKLDQEEADAEAAALAQAKTEAKEKLAAYRATKADADYRDAQVAELNNAVTAGNAAIDAATTEAAVAEALAGAKAALDAVKTDVELDAEEENEKPNWPVYPGTPSKPSAPAKPVNPVKEFTFKDVVESDWYYDEVKDAFENGLIDGMTADSFAPNKELTVAQAIKLAAALHQLDKLGRVNLENGTDTWYSTYVRYAVANEIIGEKYATYTKAQMNDPISREEFVHIFHGAMEYYAEKNDVTDNAIPDVKLGDDYANEIYTFYRAGILTGSDAKGTFYPNSSIKRSEVAAILIRMYDKTARQFVTLG